MDGRRILAVSRKNAKGILRQKRSLMLVLLAPLIAMLLFGFVFAGHPQNVSVIVVNQDDGYLVPGSNQSLNVSSMVLSNMNDLAPDHITFSFQYMNNLSNAVDNLKNGDVYAVIYFPQNFSKETYSNLNSATPAYNASVQVYLDNSNIVGGDGVSGTVEQAVSIVDHMLGQSSAIGINETPVYGSSVSFMDYFLPGILAFIVYFLPSILTLLLFVEEKGSGTFERILSTPLTEGELVAGYALTFGLLAILQSLILIVVGILVFNIILVGNLFIALLIVILVAVGAQGLGILLSGLAHTAEEAVQILPFVVLTGLLLTGILQPLLDMPVWLQPFSYLFPTTYATTALRDVMIKGWGLGQIWVQLVVLVVFAAITLTSSVFVFKRRA